MAGALAVRLEDGHHGAHHVQRAHEVLPVGGHDAGEVLKHLRAAGHWLVSVLAKQKGDEAAQHLLGPAEIVEAGVGHALSGEPRSRSFDSY